MSLYRFVIGEELFPYLHGFVVEVSTMDYVGFEVDETRLREWCIGIADDFVRGLVSRSELVSDAIDIRVFDPNMKLLVDTIIR